MQLKLTGNVSGNSPHAAAVEMPFQVRRRARGQGVLRLLKNFVAKFFTPLRMTVYLVLIDSPANTICASHFSARSAQRGFFDSISAIFFLLTHLFSCFSRSIAFLTSSKPS